MIFLIFTIFLISRSYSETTSFRICKKNRFRYPIKIAFLSKRNKIVLMFSRIFIYYLLNFICVFCLLFWDGLSNLHQKYQGHIKRISRKYRHDQKLSKFVFNFLKTKTTLEELSGFFLYNNLRVLKKFSRTFFCLKLLF